MSTIPPTAVSPEMALVTDMRGEWSAGVTPHTVCKYKCDHQDPQWQQDEYADLNFVYVESCSNVTLLNNSKFIGLL